MSSNTITYSLKDPTLIPSEVHSLYQQVGWNEGGYRTIAKTEMALKNSLAYVTARCEKQLVGFVRIIGDGQYATQIVDLIVILPFRQQGIASHLMNNILSYAKGENITGVSLVDGSGIASFYERLGFVAADSTIEKLMYFKSS